MLNETWKIYQNYTDAVAIIYFSINNLYIYIYIYLLFFIIDPYVSINLLMGRHPHSAE